MIVIVQSRLFYFSVTFVSFFFFWSLPPQQISIINTHAHTHIHTGYEFRNIEWRENEKKKKKTQNVGKKGNVAAVKQAFGFLT
jgi:hypothetical protein